MDKSLLIIVLIAVLILVFAVFATIKFKKQKEIRKNNPGYPKGYWMEQGTAVGVAIGAAIGVALGNIAIGVAIGVAIGAAIGSEWQKKHKDEIRPILPEEKKLRKQTIGFIFATLIIGTVVFAAIYFATK